MFTHLPEHLEGSWTLSCLFVFPHHTMTRERMVGRGTGGERSEERREKGRKGRAVERQGNRLEPAYTPPCLPALSPCTAYTEYSRQGPSCCSHFSMNAGILEHFFCKSVTSSLLNRKTTLAWGQGCITVLQCLSLQEVMPKMRTMNSSLKGDHVGKASRICP